MKYIKSYNESLFSVRKEGIIKICKKYDIRNYTINDDLSIDVDNGVDLSVLNLKKLPLRFNKINGEFDCSNNKLISLSGSPKYVEGAFFCYENELTNLIESPIRCEGIYAQNNNLTTLDGWNKTCNIEYNDNPIDEVTTLIMNYITKSSKNDLTLPDLLESEKEIWSRLEEFEVVKDNKLDLISLNSLFDFYEISFDEKEFKNIKGYVY